MKVLVTGSGGREHALAWRLSRSPQVEKVFVAPGNAGTALEPNIENIDLDVMDIPGQVEFARAGKIDLTVIGPEVPLVAGAVDAFIAAGLRCFGPTKGAAELEGSKTFTKEFLERHKIPTARYGSFSELELAYQFLDTMSFPVVIKADGLAAGKGVVIASTRSEADAVINDMLSGNRHGDAGSKVVIEEFLLGEEASFIVIVDGENFIPFATSQDHKPIFDGDEGPNTGGMGAYSPAPVVTPDIHARIVSEVIEPTVSGMATEGRPYTGFLYAGLMIAPDGTPNVIEFNCRFGDPETQPIMLRLQSDLAELCQLAIDGKLAGEHIDFDSRAALTVVMAAGGYPGDYRSGDLISGLGEESGEVKVFHAGTRQSDEGVVTAGGRVLGVTAMAESVSGAQELAYECVDRINWLDKYARRDIGYRAVAREARPR